MAIQNLAHIKYLPHLKVLLKENVIVLKLYRDRKIYVVNFKLKSDLHNKFRKPYLFSTHIKLEYKF